MALSVRLDAKTESLIGRLARRRRQSKSEVIRDAIGVLAKQEEKDAGKKRPYDLVAHLIGCVDSGGANLSRNTGENSLSFCVKRPCPPFSLIRGRWWPCWIAVIRITLPARRLSAR